ncbi:MAG: hypothetical protein M3Z09_11100 [Acidobacteriota bacterium]|nr:hypothetical protein [Acidobacteriota bacterium]
MTKRILTGAVLLFPLFAFADVLTMKDGTRFNGTFVSGNSNTINFTEYNGNRQTLNMFDVQELRFGNERDSSQVRGDFGNAPGGYNRNPGNDNGPGRAANSVDSQRDYNRNGPVSSGSMADALDQLQLDIQAALDHANLSDDQRQSLTDSSVTLRNIAQQSRNGRPVNDRNLRLAIGAVRSATQRMQPQDRDTLMNDIQRLNVQGNGAGRDY